MLQPTLCYHPHYVTTHTMLPPTLCYNPHYVTTHTMLPPTLCCRSVFKLADVASTGHYTYTYTQDGHCYLLVMMFKGRRRANAAMPMSVMTQGSTCRQNCQDLCFIALAVGLALTTAQAQNIAIALAITLVRTS